MPNSSRSDFANSSSVQKPTDKSAKHVDNARQEIAVPDADRSLALDWILNPIKGSSVSERVLAQLLLAEAKSGDHDHKLAYRLAWHIVLHCMKGDAVECSPVTLAYYSVVGCHEEQYYDRLMIRRAAMFGDANRIQFPKNKSLTSPAVNATARIPLANSEQREPMQSEPRLDRGAGQQGSVNDWNGMEKGHVLDPHSALADRQVPNKSVPSPKKKSVSIQPKKEETA